ncbi:hypothetical protein HG537_0C02230 [Torulaspora globosa]|uniref:DNA damage-inducible protein 1 n=1 Tax=Torulaspora globosa TaxID=48254 RepID=A0A7H9HQU4_9SACH|nr:hypothetical protein HG537_0C02230 [Torulaspora sp. CBS 2947]
MNLTISNEITDQIYGPLELNAEMTLQDLTALLHVDCGFDEQKHELLYNSAQLDPGSGQSLGQVFTGDSHLVVIRAKNGVEALGTSDDAVVEQFRQELLGNQLLRSQLGSQIPGFSEILENPQLFRERMGPVILQRRYGMGGANQALNPFGIPDQEYKRLMSDPDDPQNQVRIAELINQQEIDEQMRNALEYTPEMFTSVHMLFVSLEINGHPVKAFVDSGAQTTIMSTRLAETTGLTRLIDKRFIGEARGVGVGKILGRIHQAQIKIETQYIPCSFTVLDTHVDLLLGLDMLKRHQACIDLQKDVLRIAGVETRFLSESEIPKDFVENMVGPNPAAAGNPETKPGPSSRAAAPADQGTAAFPETVIKHLMDLGFSRKEVIAALQRAGGNSEIAASILFQ